METQTPVQNIRAEINALEVGEMAPFPIARYDYVLSCRGRLQTTTDKIFTSKKNGANVEITRTA